MRKRGDRAWWSWLTLRGEKRIRVYLVERGVRTTETLPREATAREAERRVRILTAALARGDVSAPADWTEAIDAFIASRANPRPATVSSYRSHLGSVQRTLAGSDPLALTTRDAERYHSAIIDAGLSASTAKGGMQAVRIFQRWAVAQGWLTRATWEEAELPEVLSEKRHLQHDEMGRFLRAAERLGARWPEWPAAAYLLCHGLRTSEGKHLLVRDIDLTAGVVQVVDRVGSRTKTATSVRSFPVLSASALACLRRTFRDLPGDAPAFPTGKRRKDEARAGAATGRTKWFARRCEATCAEAEIGVPVTPHGLRHTVATAAVVAGADMHSVQALLGHADARTTARIYSHATAAQRAHGAAVVVGAWLDRVVEARPGLEAV